MSEIEKLINQTEKKPAGFLKRLLVPSDWLILVGLFLTLGIVVWLVQQAHWIKAQPSLVITLGIALLVGLVLVKSRLPAYLAHPMALIMGCGVVYLQAIMLFPDTGLAAKSAHLILDINAWLRTIRFGEPSPGTIHIALLFGLLAWIIGYLSAWFTVKRHSPWLAVSLSTFIILITLNFLSRDKYIYFVLFLLAALLLMALVNFIKQNKRTLPHDRNGFRRGWIYWVSISIAIMVIAVFFSWNSPQVKIHQVQAFARDKNPWRETIDLYWRNFFAPVPGNSVGLAHGGQYDLTFGGSLVLSDQVVFVIKTDRSIYWKTQVYDYYDTTGWKASPTKEISLNKGEIATPIASWPEYSNLSYTLLPQINTNVVPVPGDLVSGDFPMTERDLTPLQFTLNLVDSSQDSLLPPDLASLAVSLRAARITTRNDRTITSRLPVGIKLVAVNRENSLARSLTVVRTATEDEDAISISSFSPMSNQKPYQLNARVPANFTPDQLMKAGEGYPEDITDRYLQLPSDFPGSVKDLTASLTADIDNAYAKSLLIKSYLSKIPYSLTIKAPPLGADGVEYFLFTQESGYCTYFASAMAVMLRSAGIPARMAVGFTPGQYDASEQRFLIRDRDYHAWTEVYFPGYGWVLFDPTPSSSPELSAGSGDSSNPIYPLDPFFNPDIYDPGAPIPGSSAPLVQPKSYTGYIAGGITSALLLVVFFAWYLVYRRPGGNSALYSRMVVLASLAGLGPRASQTPLEYSHQLSTVLPAQAQDIGSITEVYVDVRYGKRPLESDPRRDLTDAWQRLRSTLLKRVFRVGK